MKEARDYQERAIVDIREEFRKGVRSVLYVLPTGGGKSFVFNRLANKVGSNGFRICIAVHSDYLIKQNVEALQWQDIPFGVISPNYTPNRTAPIQIASVWTLARRLADWPNFDLIINDEGHRLPSATFAKVHHAYPKAYHLTVTATPERLDGKGLGDFCHSMVLGPSMRELAERGFLAPCDVFGPPTQLDLSQVHTAMGDYVKKELEGVLDTPAITGDAVDHYRRYLGGNGGKPAIVFGVSLKHLDHVVQQFQRAGWKAASVDGTMSMQDRVTRLNDLKAGRLNILASCQLLTEGVDTPAAQGVILLRPTQSLTLYLQMIGRGMRPKAGPDGLGPGGRHTGDPMILLDHVGNVLRHGLPDIEREWTLEGRTKRGRKQGEDEAAASVRVCPACFCVNPAHLRKCRKCGQAFEIQSREIEERPGELVRLTPEQIKQKWKEEQSDPNLRERREVLEARDDDNWVKGMRARLTTTANERGYNPRWIEHQIQAKRRKLAQQGGKTA